MKKTKLDVFWSGKNSLFIKLRQNKINKINDFNFAKLINIEKFKC